MRCLCFSFLHLALFSLLRGFLVSLKLCCFGLLPVTKFVEHFLTTCEQMPLELGLRGSESWLVVDNIAHHWICHAEAVDAVRKRLIWLEALLDGISDIVECDCDKLTLLIFARSKCSLVVPAMSA